MSTVYSRLAKNFERWPSTAVPTHWRLCLFSYSSSLGVFTINTVNTANLVSALDYSAN